MIDQASFPMYVYMRLLWCKCFHTNRIELTVELVTLEPNMGWRGFQQTQSTESYVGLHLLHLWIHSMEMLATVGWLLLSLHKLFLYSSWFLTAYTENEQRHRKRRRRWRWRMWRQTQHKKTKTQKTKTKMQKPKTQKMKTETVYKDKGKVAENKEEED